MSKIRAIIKRPDEEYGHVANISATLENLQRTVGGYIEVVQVDEDVVIICNEEGKLLGLEPNMFFRGDTLVGTIIAAGFDGEGFADVGIPFDYWKAIIDESNGGAR